jgi:hypothetical protein
MTCAIFSAPLSLASINAWSSANLDATESFRIIFGVSSTDHQWAPGGNTGMVITGEKAVGKKIIKTHEFDATISRELRETEKQVAIELKQWSEKGEHKFDPIEWLRTASVEELRAALPALRAEREKLGLPAPPKLKPN